MRAVTGVCDRAVVSGAREARAEALRAAGNAAFRRGDWATAERRYSEALMVTPDSHMLYSNRASAFSKLKRYADALGDAKEAVSLQPTWPKGWLRSDPLGVQKRGCAQACPPAPNAARPPTASRAQVRSVSSEGSQRMRRSCA